MNKVLLFTLLLVGAASTSFAQQGYLRGKVIDGANGEGLFGATITKQGTTQGTVADFDGNFSLGLEPGTHNIMIQFVSYQSKTIEGVVIVADEVTNLDLTLSEDVQQLDAVVVTAEQIRDNEVALLAVQKKSANTIDGISAAAFKKIGDSDLGGAMKRVTGVSVEGGKYVYVRGLGDRYTKTTLNGMSIPGLDPDKNTVQMDIFPTSSIENVVVYKTFSPDLQADFTGGAIDVETKSFPEEKTTTISFGIGYNPDMHLNNDHLSYDGGKTDFLGFDDKTREIPFPKESIIPNTSAADGYRVTLFTEKFKPSLAAQEETSFMNTSFSVSHGNQVDKGNLKIGYNAILNYQNTVEYYDNVRFGEYRKEFTSDVNELQAVETRQGRQGTNSALWSALATGAVKFNQSSIALSLMRSQNGQSAAVKRVSANQDDNPAILLDDILSYTQRSVTTGILIGKHQVSDWKIDWRASVSQSSISDPDMRSTRIQDLGDGTFGLNTGVGAGIERFWRDLNETNQSFKVDITRPFGDNNKLKFGGIATLKSRDFAVYEYLFRSQGSKEISDNADDLLLPANIWTQASAEGTYVVGNFDESKQFDASQNVFGAYLMTEMSITAKLKSIYGLRMEKVAMNYTGMDQQRNVLDNETVLDEVNFLPSANLIYSLNENMNLRTSFNRTLARPSFKEKSNAQIFDPITGRTFIGNLDLEQTYINNYDFRWEYFYTANEMVSFSVFYKQFDGHIELVSFDTAPEQLKPRNSGDSRVFGIEVEFRKDINQNLSFGTNASFIKSEVDLKSVIVNEDGKSEYTLREEFLRDNETLSSTRNMAGQAPYLINGYFNYKTNDQSINANLSYNVQGETLYVIGSGVLPDTYTKPFHSLNMNASKSFGTDLQSKVTFGVDNILASKRQNVYQSFGAQDEIFSLYEPGRTFSLKYSYTF